MTPKQFTYCVISFMCHFGLDVSPVMCKLPRKDDGEYSWHLLSKVFSAAKREIVNFFDTIYMPFPAILILSSPCNGNAWETEKGDYTWCDFYQYLTLLTARGYSRRIGWGAEGGPGQAWRVEMNLFTKTIRGFIDFGKQAELKNPCVAQALPFYGIN